MKLWMKIVGLLLFVISLGVCQSLLSPKRSLGSIEASQNKRVYEKLQTKIKTEILPRHREVSQITVEEFQVLQGNQEKTLLVDVRETKEQLSLMEGAITLVTFEKQIKEQKIDKSVDVVFYCTIGWRSSDAALKYQRLGWKTHNLLGGVLSWSFVGGKFVDTEGKPTNQVHVYSEDWNFLASGYEAIVGG